MSTKRKLQKELTRERIIAAAFKVYSEQGFTAAASAIAHEAGVSQGSIFVHFPTVDSLVLCLLDSFSQDLRNEILALEDSGGDIERLLDMHIGVLIKHEAFYTRLITEAALLPQEAKHELVAIQSTVSIHFMQALEPQMKTGTVKGIPFHMIFNTWLGLVHYYLMNADLFAPHDSVLTRHKRTLTKTFLALIENRTLKNKEEQQ
ncbi:MAG: TetR/AcrR family transcriptional regulator [Propionibacteriaceae bacterium]|jgi:AcrR family transcriptional regulator|nr:TetR/AcrR family transcriptional regulator [Propionibacteriaceae bacterium]